MAFIVVCEIPCFDVVLNEVRYCETVLFNTVNQFSVIALVRVIDKIIVDDKDVQDARVYLTYAVSQVLKQGANLLGIEMPEKM